ncbi:MAG: ArsA-related P-loop ATPase [Acidimicrobiales bacterium]
MTLLRVAFVGKGGVGKSAVAGTFARTLARQGAPVLALDSDPMPGLAFSLGIDVTDVGIPDDAVQERVKGEDGPRFRLRDGLTAADAVERYSVAGPDGVLFLQFAKLRGHMGTTMKSQFAFRQILEQLPEDRWALVGDLPGGMRQPFFGWGDFAHTIFVVVEPTVKSMRAGRRLARLALTEKPPAVIAVVANKVREEGDIARVAEATGLPVVASVPWDEALAAAEQAGLAPIDEAPDSPAVLAIAALVDQVMATTA